MACKDTLFIPTETVVTRWQIRLPLSFYFILKLYVFIYLAAPSLNCGTQDLQSLLPYVNTLVEAGGI